MIVLLSVGTHCAVLAISIPTPRNVIGNSEGGGGGEFQKIVIKGKYEARLEFPV